MVRGARSNTDDGRRPSTFAEDERANIGLENSARRGDDDRMPVVDVGIGVGYLRKALESKGLSRACLFDGRGKPGDEESGSNGGKRDGAGRFVPTPFNEEADTEAGGRVGSSFVAPSIFLTGDEDMMEERKIQGAILRGITMMN